MSKELEKLFGEIYHMIINKECDPVNIGQIKSMIFKDYKSKNSREVFY